MSLASASVPTVVASSLVCLLLGAGGGVLGMCLLGYSLTPIGGKDEGEGGPKAANKSTFGGQGAPPGMGGGPPGGGGGGPPGMGGGGGGMGGGGRGNPSKGQLASLVTKLDQLTQKPLAVNLSDEQRAKVSEQLKGLDDMEDLSDEEAQKRLNGLLAVLEKDKETLEAAGYRWPSAGGGGGGGMMGGPPAAPPKNPFKEGKNGEHLKSLEKTAAKAKG